LPRRQQICPPTKRAPPVVRSEMIAVLPLT
jgi:hypothetical protein